MAKKGSNKQANIILGLNMTQFQKGLRTAQARLKGFGKTMSRFGSSMTRSVTLPLVGAAVAGIKMASDLEKAFAKIENLVGVTGPVLEGFKTKLKEISTETATAQGSLADALFVITSAGIRSAAAMDILSVSAKSSQVGMGETEAIARGITGAMNSYAKSGLDAARAGDIMMAIVREGNLVAEDLAPTLGRVTGMAAQLGISFEELGANIATFTRLGVPTEEAVTGLRGVMAAVLKPTKAAKDIMDSLGTSSSKLREKVGRDGLHNTLMSLIDALKGNDEGLSSMFGNVRALSNVLGTAGAQGKAYGIILDSINSSVGMVDESFENASKESFFKFNQAIVDLKNNAIELGVELLPLAVKVAEKITNLAKAFREMNPSVRKSIIVIGGIVALLGPLALVIGATSTSIAAGIGLISKTIATAHPILLALTVATVALTSAFAYFSTESKIASSSLDDNTKSILKNQAEANLLLDTIARTNITQSTRNRLINEYNLKYGKYAGNLSKEKTAIDDIRKVQVGMNIAFKDKIKAMVLEKVIANHVENQAKRLVTIKEKELQLSEELASLSLTKNMDDDALASLGMSAESLIGLNEAAETSIQNLRDGILALQNAGEVDATMLADLQDQLTKILDKTTELTKPQKPLGLVDSVKFLEQEIKDLISWLDTNELSFYEADEDLDELNEFLDGLEKLSQQMAFSASIVDFFGSSMESAFRGAIENGESFLQNMQNMLKQLTAKLLAAAGAAIILGIALSAIMGGVDVGGVFLKDSKLILALFNQFSGLKVPALAAGGLAFGPTLAMVGDNNNASIDPEVVAPLSKLKAMMGGGNGQNITVTGRLSGSDLLISNERAGRQRSRYRGF